MQTIKHFSTGKLAAAVFLQLALGLGGCGPIGSRTDADYLTRAAALREQGDLRGAAIELKNALQKNPENLEARRLLGIVDIGLGSGEAAEKELRRALELGTAKAALLVPLAESLQLQGKHQALLDEISPTPDLPAQDEAAILAYRGDAWLGLGKRSNARAEYERALALDTHAPLAMLGLARLSLAERDLDQARLRLSEGLAAAPNEARIWSFQAALQEGAGEFAQAEESYTKAIELDPYPPSQRVGRALVRISLKKLDEAAEDIALLKKDAPNFHFTHYAEGLLDLNRARYSEAQAAFETAERLNDKYPLTLYYLGLSHLAQNHLSQAEQCLARFLNRMPGSVGGTQYLALTRYKQKDYAGARNLLAPVAKARADNPEVLKLMGEIELALGNTEQGIEYLRKVVELDPKSASARTGLGLSLLADGRKDEGLAELNAAVELDAGSAQPEIYIALAHIQARAFDRALAATDRVREKAPDSPVADILTGMVQLGRNAPEQAQQAFRDALAKKPGDPAISHRLAQLALLEKRPDRARRYYEEALNAHPRDLATQLRLAQLDGAEGKLKDLADRLATTIKDHPEALEPRLLQAGYFLRFGQSDRAEAVLEEVRGRYPRNPELLSLLAQAQMANRQATTALATARALAEAAPRSAMAHYLLARAYSENRDLDGLRKALERSLALNPDFFLGRVARVKLLVTDRKTGEADRELAALAGEFHDNPEILALQGWVAAAQNRFGAAADAYRKALEKLPSTQSAMSLAQAQWNGGDKAGAVKVLEDWTAAHGDDSLARYLLSVFYTASGQIREAEGQLEKLLEANPRNVFALNDLAWLRRKEAPDQALALAERALEIAPDSPAVLDTLAMVLLEKGRHDRATELLRRVIGLAPQDPSPRFHWALALSKAGKARDSEKVLAEVLSGAAEFPERREAEDLFERLKKRR
jgi:putative PEP-CTERM system TPR-repeat lipoprotein